MARVAEDRTAAEIAGLDPSLQPIVREIVGWAREAGWPVVIRALGGRRTAQQQRELYARGRSAPGPIVTGTLQSAHISGRAFDLDLMGYPRAAGMPLWRLLGAWWQSIGGRWGGSWGDYGHFELL